MIGSIFASLFLALGIVFLLGLTPQRITEDCMRIISPRASSLRSRALIARGGKKTRRLAGWLVGVQFKLEDMDKGRQFPLIFTVSLAMGGVGILLGALLGNPFLAPVLCAIFAVLPFLYLATLLAHYDRHVRDELETALSIITTSYVRNADLVNAVRENLPYIRPPVREAFRRFVARATLVSADLKSCLADLRGRFDNAVFREWCDTLAACLDDSTLKTALLPVVGRMTEARLTNSELNTMLESPRREYLTMALLTVGNVPLLYLLNRDWFHILVATLPGKAVLAATGAVLLVTALLMLRFTKPVEYKS